MFDHVWTRINRCGVDKGVLPAIQTRTGARGPQQTPEEGAIATAFCSPPGDSPGGIYIEHRSDNSLAPSVPRTPGGGLRL